MTTMPPHLVDDDTEADVDLTPEQIANAQFVGSVRGYNREDVDAFLRGVADDYQRVVEELRGLRATMDHAPVTPPATDEPHPGDTPSPAPSHEEAAMAVQASTDDESPVEDTTPAPSEQRSAPSAKPEAPAGVGSSPPAGDDVEVRALLLAADEEAWAIRDAAEDELDHSRLEAMHAMELAMRRATELRDDARRRARASLDSDGEVAELAETVSRQLRDADAAANEVLRSARAETRQNRRSMYQRLAQAEAQARAVLDEAHEQACSLLRGTPGATGH